MTLFTGSGVAIITPFKDNKIDFESLGKLIDWQIAESTDAIVICGTTGESSTLDDQEHIDAVKYTVEKVAKRVPVIAGAGSNDTRYAIELSKKIEEVGADGLLHVTPYYNKATQAGLILHYTAIADAVNIPIILYNVPGRTGVNLSPKTVAELAKHKNIQGIKEASGDIAQVAEISRLTPDDFDIYSGNDDMIVPLLSVGGRGVISTVANVAPKDTHDMVMKFLEGDVKGACKLQLDMRPLIDAMFIEVNPIPVKAAVHLMGKCENEYRLPMCEPSTASLEFIKKEMKAWGLI